MSMRTKFPSRRASSASSRRFPMREFGVELESHRGELRRRDVRIELSLSAIPASARLYSFDEEARSSRRVTSSPRTSSVADAPFPVQPGDGGEGFVQSLAGDQQRLATARMIGDGTSGSVAPEQPSEDAHGALRERARRRRRRRTGRRDASARGRRPRVSRAEVATSSTRTTAAGGRPAPECPAHAVGAPGQRERSLPVGLADLRGSSRREYRPPARRASSDAELARGEESAFAAFPGPSRAPGRTRPLPRWLRRKHGRPCARRARAAQVIRATVFEGLQHSRARSPYRPPGTGECRIQAGGARQRRAGRLRERGGSRGRDRQIAHRAAEAGGCGKRVPAGVADAAGAEAGPGPSPQDRHAGGKMKCSSRSERRTHGREFLHGGRLAHGGDSIPPARAKRGRAFGRGSASPGGVKSGLYEEAACAHFRIPSLCLILIAAAAAALARFVCRRIERMGSRRLGRGVVAAADNRFRSADFTAATSTPGSIYEIERQVILRPDGRDGCTSRPHNAGSVTVGGSTIAVPDDLRDRIDTGHSGCRTSSSNPAWTSGAFVGVGGYRVAPEPRAVSRRPDRGSLRGRSLVSSVGADAQLIVWRTLRHPRARGRARSADQCAPGGSLAARHSESAMPVLIRIWRRPPGRLFPPLVSVSLNFAVTRAGEGRWIPQRIGAAVRSPAVTGSRVERGPLSGYCARRGFPLCGRRNEFLPRSVVPKLALLEGICRTDCERSGHGRSRLPGIVKLFHAGRALSISRPPPRRWVSTDESNF